MNNIQKLLHKNLKRLFQMDHKKLW